MTTKRWYDQDPGLSEALERLRRAEDKYQAQVALNIIKVMVEHKSEGSTQVPVEELMNPEHQPTRHPEMAEMESLLGDTLTQITNQHPRRRWYDVNETLRSAMTLLQDTPADLQTSLIPSVTDMIERTLGEVLGDAAVE